MLVVMLGLVLFVLRRVDGVWQPTIWAEDGRVFWAAALYPGFDLLSPYAAQWWLAQRLLVLGVVQLPVVWAPRVMFLAAALVAVLAAATILQSRSRALFGAYRYQIVAFALVLLIPVAWEVHGNLTNIQVWLGVGLLVTLAIPAPTSRVGRVIELAFVWVAGLTGFLGVLLSPMAVWSVATAKTTYNTVRSVLLLAAACCNLAVWWSAGRAAGEGALARMLQVPENLLYRWGGGTLFGEYPLRVVSTGGRFVLMVATVFLLVVLAAAWNDRRGPSPVWLLVASLWAVLAILSPTGAVGSRWMFDPQAHWRYFALGVAACLLVLVRALGTTRVRWPYGLALVACVPALTLGARLPGAGPAIPEGDLRAFAECLHAPGGLCAVDIAPEGWTVLVLVPERSPTHVTSP